MTGIVWGTAATPHSPADLCDCDHPDPLFHCAAQAMADANRWPAVLTLTIRQEPGPGPRHVEDSYTRRTSLEVAALLRSLADYHEGRSLHWAAVTAAEPKVTAYALCTRCDAPIVRYGQAEDGRWIWQHDRNQPRPGPCPRACPPDEADQYEPGGPLHEDVEWKRREAGVRTALFGTNADVLAALAERRAAGEPDDECPACAVANRPRPMRDLAAVLRVDASLPDTIDTRDAVAHCAYTQARDALRVAIGIVAQLAPALDAPETAR